MNFDFNVEKNSDPERMIRACPLEASFLYGCSQLKFFYVSLVGYVNKCPPVITPLTINYQITSQE